MSNGTALAIVQQAKNNGALVFANMEHLEAKVELYKTEVTQITFSEKDFHTINGKKMPNKAATDRIGEASGVQFIQAACRVTAETLDDEMCGNRTVYRAKAQGKIRMPDGSWRESTVDEYEFDPVLRAMIDKNITELNEKTKPVVARAIMNYSNVGRQRAATGARVRVIRQLIGMPSAFEPDEIKKPMVFTRIVQNTDYILNTPEGRAMATAQALGVDMATLFGGRTLPAPAMNHREEPQNVTPTYEETPPDDNSAASLAAQAAGSSDPDFPDEPTGPGSQPEDSEFVRLGLEIEQLMGSYHSVLDTTTESGKNPYKLAQNELNNSAATEESHRSMRDRLVAYLKAKGVNV